MSRKVDGVQGLQYRKDGITTQRCSRCHDERQASSLVRQLSAAEQLFPIMVGQDLVGVLCASCVEPIETLIQGVFPDRHAFPFIGSRGELLPNPRCELGHALTYTPDGREMVCPECDAMPRERFTDPGVVRAELDELVDAQGDGSTP